MEGTLWKNEEWQDNDVIEIGFYWWEEEECIFNKRWDGEEKLTRKWHWIDKNGRKHFGKMKNGKIVMWMKLSFIDETKKNVSLIRDVEVEKKIQERSDIG